MKETLPKYSVTIPAYKSYYLEEAIISVLSQTIDNFELVIVNDHSPQDLDSIVSKFTDKRIHYYENRKNCGAINVVDNWNKCLEYSKGQYIICMGDDDMLFPNCLEEYDKLMQKYPDLDVYHGWTEIIDEHSITWMMQEPRPEKEGVYSMIWNRWHGRKQYVGDFLFKIEKLRKIGGFYSLPLGWASDDISAYSLAINKGIANTQTPIFKYRVSHFTISSIGNAKVKVQSILKEKKWIDNFLQNEPYEHVEKVYYSCIKREKNDFFRKKIQTVITNDIRNALKGGFINGLNCWYIWLIKRNETTISISLMLWILVLSIKNRLK